MISLGTTVRWLDDVGVVFKVTVFNEGMEDDFPEWAGCVLSVRWQRSPAPTVHIFYSDGEQGFGFPIMILKNEIQDT